MKLIDTNKVTVTNGEVIRIDLNKGNVGDTIVPEIYVRPLSNIGITVKGFMKGDTDGLTLKTMDVGNFQVKDSITTAGIYQILSGAYQYVTLTINGSGDIIISKNF